MPESTNYARLTTQQIVATPDNYTTIVDIRPEDMNARIVSGETPYAARTFTHPRDLCEYCPPRGLIPPLKTSPRVRASNVRITPATATVNGLLQVSGDFDASMGASTHNSVIVYAYPLGGGTGETNIHTHTI